MNKVIYKMKSTVGCGYRTGEKYLKDWNFRQRVRYARYYKNEKVNERIVLYESFYGRGMLCNPYAIFLELLDDPKYKELIHVWVLDDPENHQELCSLYKNRKNVKFVKFQSKEYLKYLCSAKYLFNNSTFMPYFIKKEEQIYVNTWHGIPLKYMGFDMPNGKIEGGNVVRNFLHADYLLAANPSMTEMYKKSYKLDYIYNGKIIEEGYPRLDLLFKFDRDVIIKKMKRSGVALNPDKKLILYAPTWRGNSFQDVSTDVEKYYKFKEELEKCIDISKYQILIKVHQRVYELAKDDLIGDFFVPSTVDANEVLGISDILISDFSSIFFDYLATDKPVLFYIPDLIEYKTNRGMYFGTEKLPGPFSDCIGEIGKWINEIDKVSKQYKDLYEEMKQWSNAFSKGDCTKKIIDIVFQKKENHYQVMKTLQGKKRLLISKGQIARNGITTSLIGLLNKIDYERFDVSLMIFPVNKKDNLALLNRINENVRVLTRVSVEDVTFYEEILRIYYERNNTINVKRPMQKKEYLRCFGKTQFDYVIDFDGYNIPLTMLCLQAENAKKIIWQHNDMLAEKELRFPWLERVFQSYKYFDKVVSCSYDTMLVNRKNLSEKYCAYEKFTYMRNIIDSIRIEQSLNQNLIKDYDGKKYIAVDETEDNGCKRVKLIPYLKEDENNQISNYCFVTMGRMSPEKNQENLIRAFGKLEKEYPNIVLYMLGAGKLERKLLNLVKDLHLTEKVIFTGNVDNPFVIMKKCDCFILPSLHEGQPMVINEARVLHMPIIVSNFSSVNGVLIKDGQLLIGTSENEICEGMREYIKGNVPADYVFDVENYNEEVYQEFLKVLEI